MGNVRLRRIVAGWVAAALLGGLAWLFTLERFDAVGQGAADAATSVASGVYEYPPEDRGKTVTVTGTTLEGDDLSTTAYAGDVVVLNVWGSWCAPCREEAPVLSRAAQQYGQRGVSFLGINVRDNPAAALAFERRYRIPYPSLREEDSPGALLDLGDYIPLQAVPVTILLDRQGRVAARVIGVLRAATLRALLEPIVEEPVPSDVNE